ncbi:AraC family transcriptional regulator [Pacificibacter maritimus]|uniref:AraC family transcriptional regulator n=1 Tax=Pacificibacter maritimus TaxID=762213 RepID=A0A3N4UM02_9RHOB|nr:AraC family transcriptional regulator [Pacificibacter maritimus]RPE71666.1 AraC family transcriptional regulator [Pacificibacter maritimus]
MDKNELGPFSGIPTHAVGLQLTRSTIKMTHSPTWRVDKSNPVHDLIICLTGAGKYNINGETVILTPGQALLVPAGTRFQGQTHTQDRYTGVAQHFSLTLFGTVDMLSQMSLIQSTPMPNWDVFRPLVQHYHDTAPETSTTLGQHHMFMVILLAYLEAAFLGWHEKAMGAMDGQDALSLHIMLAAARLGDDPLAPDALERTLDRAPFNPDYFRRAFRDRIGQTPQKFLESKKMDKAMHALMLGKSVKEVAAEVGYQDAYFFSRMFKRYMGKPPSAYRLKSRDKALREKDLYSE